MVLLFIRSFVLALSALLPVINPLGSALMFLEVVGFAPADEFKRLARKVAFRTILFLLIIELTGAALLNFFDISLPVVQLAGGLVLAAMGWQLLNNEDRDQDKDGDATPVVTQHTSTDPLENKIFYPLTFPLTAGPGCIVVTVTLGAHASFHSITENIIAHLGIALAIVASGFTVLLSYAYAPKITQKIAPQTVRGILRVIAFVLLCIGVQIAWKGLQAMIKGMA